MEEIEIINSDINIEKLRKIAQNQFGDFVKAVVDVEKEIIAIGGELHADEEAVLLKNGSKQNNLWGINLYVEKNNDEFIEFDSIINIRPSQNNRSRDVEDSKIRKKIKKIVNKLVKR